MSNPQKAPLSGGVAGSGQGGVGQGQLLGGIAKGEPFVAVDPGDIEDFQWIKTFIAGKEEGFNRLVLKHKDRVFSLCLRLFAYDRDEAEDAAQETFVRVYQGLAGFKMEAKFSSWVYRIAVNVCKNRLMSSSYRESHRSVNLEASESEGSVGRSREVDLNQAIDLGRSPSSQTPSQVLEAKSNRERIEAAIARLPEEQRTLVVLRDVEGLSYEEIAATTGLNSGTVKSRLNRGRQQLQEWLRQYFLPVILVAILWMIQL